MQVDWRKLYEEAKQLLDSLGVQIDPKYDRLQAARAVSNQLALLVRNPESSMGMPGALSEKDLTFLKESMPRIQNTPGGNKLMIEAFKRLNSRVAEKAVMATEYEQANGRFNKADFERQWQEHINVNNLFDDMVEVAAPAAPDSAAAASDLYQMSDDDLAARLKAARERVRE
jgi:hypothetical protein